MDIESRRASAVIYRFPPGGRAALQRNARKPGADPVVTIPSGRGWYHDVAIREDAGPKDPAPRR